MFTKVRTILATQPLEIVSMERREELANNKFTLNGNKAVLMGLDQPQPTVVDLKRGFCQPTSWEAVEVVLRTFGGDFESIRHWRTTSYFWE
jgi:hypothetical protein